MQKLLTGAVCATVLVTACTPVTYSVTPVPLDGQEVRYDRGAASVFSRGEAGSVQVTPMGVNEQGRLEFAVAVLNESAQAYNIGVENADIAFDGTNVRIFTYEELEQQARNSAMAAAVLVALAGAAAAYSAHQNAYSSGYGSYSSPYGTSTYSWRSYSPTAAAIGTSAAMATTAASLNQVQGALDATLADLGNSVLRTTTVDPDYGFGGRIISERVTISGVHTLDVEVDWAGEVHAFQFTVAEGPPNAIPRGGASIGGGSSIK